MRDPYVFEYVKRISGGKCGLCQCTAPFNDRNSKLYLETHHIIWLSRGGTDSIENVVALCPNCHRKMHIVDDARDVNVLKRFAESREYCYGDCIHLPIALAGSHDEPALSAIIEARRKDRCKGVVIEARRKDRRKGVVTATLAGAHDEPATSRRS